MNRLARDHASGDGSQELDPGSSLFQCMGLGWTWPGWSCPGWRDLAQSPDTETWLLFPPGPDGGREGCAPLQAP